MASIETIGEAFNNGWQVSASCRHGTMDTGSSSRKCDWKYPLDMMTLVATRGRDFPMADLGDRLRCPRCGSRKISVMYVTPSNGSKRTATSR